MRSPGFEPTTFGFLDLPEWEVDALHILPPRLVPGSGSSTLIIVGGMGGEGDGGSCG